MNHKEFEKDLERTQKNRILGGPGPFEFFIGVLLMILAVVAFFSIK